MYKNSPPELKESVLVTIRAALASAINTCNAILISQPPPAIGGNQDWRIDNMISVIDGAITMYKNCPPELKESVIVTLRAALMSAVQTCDGVLGTNQALPTPTSPAVAEPAKAVSTPSMSIPAEPLDTSFHQVVVHDPPPSPPVEASSIDTDSNSRTLETIYEKVIAASGDGKFGLRSDLGANEANELAESLVEMRKTLMKELEMGIPAPGLATEKETNEVLVVAANGTTESSSVSKYQQMLAKARATKAAE
jgi:hypothetical protein